MPKSQEETVASSTITINKEDSVTPNTRNIENTSANTLSNQNLSKDSNKKDSNISVPITLSVKPVPSPSTPIPSTPVPFQSITAAPLDPVPVPKPGKWIVNETNKICIVISAAVQFNISDVSKKDNQVCIILNVKKEYFRFTNFKLSFIKDYCYVLDNIQSIQPA